jgi:hypothetical protein
VKLFFWWRHPPGGASGALTGGKFSVTCRCEFGWEEMGEAVKQKVVGFTV